MRANSLFVLFTALACSMTGTAWEQPADYDSSQKVKGEDSDRHFEGIKPKMETRTNVHKLVDKYHESNELSYDNDNKKKVYDEIYTGDEDLIASNLHIHRMYLKKAEEKKTMRHFDDSKMAAKRWKREVEDPRCELFKFNERDMKITHPYAKNSTNNYYFNNTNCVTTINALSDHKVILLTFVDIFRIEYHPECAYDYLEIRDGVHGYADLLGKVCGQAFPRQMKTTGPYAWLKFHSDDTIEYEGFYIKVDFEEGTSRTIPESCYHDLDGWAGHVDFDKIRPECISGSSGQALDVLWTIKTPEDTKIYLNFSRYSLSKPNECGENVVQVFGSVLELDAALAHYCGSVANPVSTKDEPGNIMHVRLYASKASKSGTKLNATYTAYKSMDPAKEEKCPSDLFDCEDNTCISKEVVCDRYANCRLKADEGEVCKKEAESTLKQPHILAILVIFSLILSGMSFVFVFKCIRKLYQDHKIIKEHIRQSCEDRLDSLVGRSLTLDAKRLQRDSEPRASLERENHTNEMFKQQRKLSKNAPTSIDSDFQETHVDLEDEPWSRDVDASVQPENVRIERNGKSRRSDMSKKEESIRSRTKDRDEHRARKEIRDVSVGAPDTKESGCQTRESLFEPATAPSSDGSGSNSRGFSTFGYSGATIARPSTPAQTNTSEITIELLRQVPSHHEVKSQKKPDRRPMSTETTRSAPDVIIVSKPIR